jgi:hypothetical protein
VAAMMRFILMALQLKQWNKILPKVVDSSNAFRLGGLSTSTSRHGFLSNSNQYHIRILL